MTVDDINNRKYALTDLQLANIVRLAKVVTELEGSIGYAFTVTSGLRSAEDQLKINPAKKLSAHLTGEAVDVADKNGEIYQFCLDNINDIIRLGLYLESRDYTPTWTHQTIRAPKSGNRFFIP